MTTLLYLVLWMSYIAMKQGTGNRTWVHQGLADWAAGYTLSGTQVGTVCLWRFGLKSRPTRQSSRQAAAW